MSTTQESIKSDHDAPTPPVESRAGAARFLGSFLILVTLILIVYHFNINSSANIRYLYIVAKSTSAILDVVGYESEVDIYRDHYSPKILRDELTLWGLEKHVNPDSDAPLSAWEFWCHSAEQAIRQGVGLTEHGPSVFFVARDGTPTREFTFRIVPGCGAIPSMAIFFSAVFAFPAAWRKKLTGIACGLLVLFGINLGRLVVLAHIGAYDSTETHHWFTFAHEYVFQAVFMLFVGTVWLVWVEWVRHEQEKA
ncbi:MAG: hypothetical protein VCD00_09670 [Candidatus Hydrogenedentota bacterium]